MYRVMRGHGHGKTYDLIKYAIKNDCVIITDSVMRAKHIEDMAERTFGKKVEAYCINDVPKFGYKNLKFVVDELEMCMQRVLMGKLVGWNMSME